MAEPIANSTLSEQTALYGGREQVDAKNKTLKQMKFAAVCDSVSRMTAVMGMPLLSAGLIGICLYCVGTAGMPLWLAAGMTGAGVVLQTVSTVADYVSTQVKQVTNFDQLAIAAQSNAKHLVKELEAGGLALQPGNEAKTRCSGQQKNWKQSVAKPTEQTANLPLPH